MGGAMSIFKANELATKAYDRALDAAKAAETCDRDRTLQLISQAQKLISQARDERDKHVFAFGETDRLESELKVARKVSFLLLDADRLISEAQFSLEQCRRSRIVAIL